ncbi:alpha/beta hydrolase [Nocardiopsis sp. LOL_012]|uniref:alpha/beta hydrolase n=1 Tax=Nocardiopsis sp. LOL_012 TaxID=3345409 RepID=UPI003A86C12D
MTDAIDRPKSPIHLQRHRLVTSDGVPLDAALRRSDAHRTTAVVLANGFTGTHNGSDTRAIAEGLMPVGDVLTFDFRGHFDSGGRSTVGNAEIHDLEAAVAHLRGQGYTSVATVGFSMGAAVAVRHAAAFGGVSAVVSVSGPSRWYYRGTRRMRLLHFGVHGSLGRAFLRYARKVRVTDQEWTDLPAEPRAVAGDIAPVPLLVVHGDADAYFPVSHAVAIHDAAREPRELWVVPGMKHAERGVTPELTIRLRDWLLTRVTAHQG